MMKRILIFSIIICTILIAQVSLSSIQILAWDTSNGKWSWYTLGTGFTKVGNVISVTPAAPATGISIVKNVKLTLSSNVYILPTDAPNVNLSVYVNGLRYISPSDYTIVNKTLVPTCIPDSSECNWSKNALVVIDYEK